MDHSGNVVQTGGSTVPQVTDQDPGRTGRPANSASTKPPPATRMFPDVAMDASRQLRHHLDQLGQGGDRPSRPTSTPSSTTSTSLYWQADNIDRPRSGWRFTSRGSVDPKVDTVDDPDNHLVAAGHRL